MSTGVPKRTSGFSPVIILLALLLVGAGALEAPGVPENARASGSPTEVAQSISTTPSQGTCAYIKVLPFNTDIDPRIIVNAGPGITVTGANEGSGSVTGKSTPTAADPTTETSADCFSVGSPVLLSGDDGH